MVVEGVDVMVRAGGVAVALGGGRVCQRSADSAWRQPGQAWVALGRQRVEAAGASHAQGCGPAGLRADVASIQAWAIALAGEGADRQAMWTGVPGRAEDVGAARLPLAPCDAKHVAATMRRRQLTADGA